MKKIAVVFGICALAAGVACSKKASDTPAPGATPTPTAEAPKAVDVNTPGTGGLLPQQIADTISKAVCKRMPTCNPSGGSETDCETSMSKDMAASLPEKARNIAQAQLDGCTAAITKATCEQLQADKAPTGCEFMN